MTDDFFMKLCRDSMSPVQGIFGKYIITPRQGKKDNID